MLGMGLGITVGAAAVERLAGVDGYFADWIAAPGFLRTEFDEPCRNGDEIAAWRDRLGLDRSLEWPSWASRPVARYADGVWSAEFAAGGAARLSIDIASDLPVTIAAIDASGASPGVAAGIGYAAARPSVLTRVRHVAVFLANLSAGEVARVESALGV